MLKIPIIDHQLQQSFVVGAAAGYVAGQIPGVTQANFPDYLSRTLSIVNNTSYAIGEYFANILTSMSDQDDLLFFNISQIS